MTLIDKMYKVHLDDSHKQVVMMVRKAQELGRKAGKEQLAKLEKAGPRWRLKDAFTGGSAGTMLDVCGFAWLIIPGKGEIVKAFKKLGGQDMGMAGHKEYFLDGMRISKCYSTPGYNLDLKLTNSQYMSVAEATVKVVSDFLNKNGIDCRWNSRID